jgi:hypothetical protein
MSGAANWRFTEDPSFKALRETPEFTEFMLIQKLETQRKSL